MTVRTEFLVLMSPHQLRKYGLPDLQLGTVLIKPAVSVRNLGAHFDQMLTMASSINHKNKVASVYKCIHRLAPNYLSSILTTRTRDNRLRQKQVCHEPNTHSCAKVVGKQAFGTRAPELWNKLPLNIRKMKLLAHMTFYSVSAVIGYAA